MSWLIEITDSNVPLLGANAFARVVGRHTGAVVPVNSASVVIGSMPTQSLSAIVCTLGTFGTTTPARLRHVPACCAAAAGRSKYVPSAGVVTRNGVGSDGGGCVHTVPRFGTAEIKTAPMTPCFA